jgi:hypothetical protein
MADKIKLKAASSSRWRVLDMAMSAFAAASVAFVTFVMPAELLARVVTVGSQAGRAAVSAAAALATLIAVSLLLRALGNAPRASKAAEVPSEPPRLRRADMHPDAPSRTPILAGRELGVPLDDMAIDERDDQAVDLEEVENVDYEAEWERPLPGFIEHEAVAADSFDAEAEEPEVAAAPSPESDLPFWVPEEAAADEIVEETGSVEAAPEESETAASDEPATMPFWADDPEPTADEALLLDEPEPAPTLPQDDHELDELGQRLPKKQALDHESLDGLVERFETGVGRRKRSGWTADQSAPASDADRKLEERLRGAIKDLRKMSRG